MPAAPVLCPALNAGYLITPTWDPSSQEKALYSLLLCLAAVHCSPAVTLTRFIKFGVPRNLRNWRRQTHRVGGDAITTSPVKVACLRSSMVSAGLGFKEPQVWLLSEPGCLAPEDLCLVF